MINFDKLVLGDINNLFTEERLEELNKKAEVLRYEVNDKFNFSTYINYNNTRISSKYRFSTSLPKSDLVNKRLKLLTNYTTAEKNYLYSKIIFSSNSQFVEFMKNTNNKSLLDINSLNNFIYLIKILKVTYKTKKRFDDKEIKLYNQCMNYIKPLIVYIKNNYLGNEEPEAIISKITEIIYTEPYLLNGSKRK